MNAFVDTGAEAYANGEINWSGDTINAALADASFTPTYDSRGNINNAQFFSDIAASIVGAPVTLAGKSAPAGILTASNPLFPLVSGATVVRIWVYKWTGTAGTSQLILAYDTGSGIPIVPDGTDIRLTWDTGIITGVPGVAQV